MFKRIFNLFCHFSLFICWTVLEQRNGLSQNNTLNAKLSKQNWMQNTKMWLVLPEQCMLRKNVHVSNIYIWEPSRFCISPTIQAVFLGKVFFIFKHALKGFHAPILTPQCNAFIFIPPFLSSVCRHGEQAEHALRPGAAVPHPEEVLRELWSGDGQPGDHQHRPEQGPHLPESKDQKTPWCNNRHVYR